MSQAQLQQFDTTIQMYKKGIYKTQSAKLLAMFKLYGWISTKVLVGKFSQYNARILEIRNGKVDGTKHKIRSERHNGVWGFKFFNKQED